MSDIPSVPADSQAVPEAVAQLERRIAEMETNHRAQLVRAELKAEAVRQGMVDLDGLKLLDPTLIDLDDAGEVRGATNVMRDLKRAKPWLFGLAGAFSSSTATAPAAAAPSVKSAMKMTHTEWQSARAELLKRR